jgi:hypothetical protein
MGFSGELFSETEKESIMSEEYKKSPEKEINGKHLCYYAIITNPLLFRNFFLPIIFGYFHREIFLDYPNILSAKYDEKNLKGFINAYFNEWRYIPLEERIEKFFLLLDEGNWRGKYNKSNYISRLFKDVDYFDRVLLMWYREKGKRRKLAKRIIDKICDKIIEHYVIRYARKWCYNKKLLREELKSIASATYLEVLEKNYYRRRRYIKPSLSKKYVTDFVQKRLQRYFEKQLKDDENIKRIPFQDISHSQQSSFTENEKSRKRLRLKKFNEKRECSPSVRETINIHLEGLSNGMKPRDIAKMQGIPPNTVSKRIERFKKEAIKHFSRNC